MQLGVANLLDRQYITHSSQSAPIKPHRYFAGRGRSLTLGYQRDF